MNAICTVGVILFVVGVIWLAVQWAGAPSGMEVPGVGFVETKDEE